MKTVIYCAILLVFIIGASAIAGAVEVFRASVDRKTFLKAIAQVESGDQDGAVGPDGERGRYQISRAVWKQHTKADFRFAHRRAFAYAIAERHFDHIVEQLEAAGWSADAQSIASAWNAGLTATINRQLSSATRDYSQRVDNLYKALRAEAKS